MENTLYLECYSGISGDMTVAALLDLGADETVLRKALKSLPVDGFEVEIGRVKNRDWTPAISGFSWMRRMKTMIMI